MRDHRLQRVRLLKALLELEEEWMESINQRNQLMESHISANQYKQENNQLKAVFSVTELSDYLGVCADSIYCMVRENQIPHVRIRRRILFHREEIVTWIHNSTIR
ncbi:helix-turn-helix domain-containing protein [Paenibacillus sp.]|uniref:helix-turn-helix domain-containing protein n=1 Tax=Paenibacillus sp. TaxID=58172 RepID=UPI0028B051FC|nr:helix-turn-helix domain-containing protein [Paenibacillus sp.]